VILQIVVRKDGSVGDITVVRTPGEDLGFEQAAMAAVQRWKYKPAMKDGKPVDVYITVVVDFRLNR